MQIQIGYDIEFDLPTGADALFALSVHPSRKSALLKPECLRIDPYEPVEILEYVARGHLGPYGKARATRIPFMGL